MTQLARKATLAGLWGMIVAGSVVGGCTYRTLEVQFRDVTTKEPVEGVRVKAGAVGILLILPTHDSDVTDKAGTATLRLRSGSSMMRVDASMPELEGQWNEVQLGQWFLYLQSKPASPAEWHPAWIRQQYTLQSMEARWRICD